MAWDQRPASISNVPYSDFNRKTQKGLGKVKEVPNLWCGKERADQERWQYYEGKGGRGLQGSRNQKALWPAVSPVCIEGIRRLLIHRFEESEGFYALEDAGMHWRHQKPERT